MSGTLFAGMGGHQSAKPTTTTWLTPPHVIVALGGRNSFDVDPCAYPTWPTARRLVCLPEDGLAVDWGSPRDRAWMNPPYTSGEIGVWLQRLANHGRGTALIFARSETEAFHGQVFERASGLLWLAGRLHFHAPHGDPDAPCLGQAKGHPWSTTGPLKGLCTACGVAKANAGAPSVLCAYGQDDLDRLAASDLPGTVHPLRFARFVVVDGLAHVPESWREVVAAHIGEEPISISDLCRALARHPKTTGRRHWQAKVRQTLQRGGFRRVSRGRWARAA